MPDTLTIQLDSEMKRTLEQKCRAIKMPVDKVVKQLIQNFLKTGTGSRRDEDTLALFIAEWIKDVKISDDEPFFGDLTCAEYFALSDAEREALWDEAYLAELDKTDLKPEREVSPHAIPAGQELSAEMRRRLNEHRAAKPPHPTPEYTQSSTQAPRHCLRQSRGSVRDRFLPDS
jgi:hypothetical protein